MMASFKQNRGYYTAAYNFKSEDIGETAPTGWTNDDETGTSTSVVSEHRNHAKILHSYDISGANDARLYRDFAAPHSSGIVEFHGTVDFQNALTYYRVLESDDTVICGVYFLGTATGFDVKNMAATTLNASEYSHGRWIHVAICFNNSGGALDCGDGENLDDGKYRVYLDTVKIDDYALTNAADADRFEIKTATSPP